MRCDFVVAYPMVLITQSLNQTSYPDLICSRGAIFTAAIIILPGMRLAVTIVVVILQLQQSGRCVTFSWAMYHNLPAVAHYYTYHQESHVVDLD